ncbi:MAG TPA: hypothetical protein VGR57_13425 [Ktedonobacterales bacterium]|nr:hypothetical protein [Ktedonobacterales bacterium]
MTVDLGAGTATLTVANQSVLDYFSIPNAFNNGDRVAATVSYAIRWQHVKQRRQVFNTDLHVAGLFLDTDASIAWSASNANGFHFTASPAGQQAVIAQIGHERNGVFFG